MDVYFHELGALKREISNLEIEINESLKDTSKIENLTEHAITLNGMVIFWFIILIFVAGMFLWQGYKS